MWFVILMSLAMAEKKREWWKSKMFSCTYFIFQDSRKSWSWKKCVQLWIKEGKKKMDAVMKQEGKKNMDAFMKKRRKEKKWRSYLNVYQILVIHRMNIPFTENAFVNRNGIFRKLNEKYVAKNQIVKWWTWFLNSIRSMMMMQ